jgi:hypothetical protein
VAGLRNRLKAGLAMVAAAVGPGSYQVEGRQVTCPHCGGQQFAKGSAQLDTRWTPRLEADQANTTSVHTLMCTGCSRIEWFGERPEKLLRTGEAGGASPEPICGGD